VLYPLELSHSETETLKSQPTKKKTPTKLLLFHSFRCHKATRVACPSAVKVTDFEKLLQYCPVGKRTKIFWRNFYPSINSLSKPKKSMKGIQLSAHILIKECFLRLAWELDCYVLQEKALSQWSVIDGFQWYKNILQKQWLLKYFGFFPVMRRVYKT